MELIQLFITLYAEVKGAIENRQHYAVYLKLLLCTCKDFWTRTKTRRWFRTFCKFMGYCKPFIILMQLIRVIVWLHNHGWPF